MTEPTPPSQEAPTPSESPVESLAAAFPQVSQIQLIEVGTPPATLWLLGVLDGNSREHTHHLARAIIAHGSRLGLDLRPLLLTKEEAASLKDREKTLAALLTSPYEPWRVALDAEADEGLLLDPASIRHMITEQLLFIDQARRTTTIPRKQALTIAIDSLRNALGFTFALENEEFTGNLTHVPDKLEGRLPVVDNDLRLLPYLETLLLKPDLLSLLSGDHRVQRRELDRALQESQKLLEKLHRHLSTRLRTEDEQRRRRRWRTVTLATLAVLTITSITAYVIATRPMSPIQDMTAVRHRGGIKGTYFNGRNFEHRVGERIDRGINFRLRRRSPMKGVKRDHFTVRWQGYLYFEKSGSRQLCASADNGAKVYIRDRLFIDTWKLPRPARRCATVHVVKGWYPTKIEFLEGGGAARFRLSVGDNTRHQKTIPANHFCCTRSSKRP